MIKGVSRDPGGFFFENECEWWSNGREWDGKFYQHNVTGQLCSR